MSDSALASAIKALGRREALSPKLIEGAFDDMLSGTAAPEQISAFLMGLAVRGETTDELVAGARALRKQARTLTLDGPLLDTCGTGGLPWVSLNTSTASAIVIAAAGGRVAKHGNRSVPPKTGSADVLEALGVTLEIDAETFARCLDEAGVAFAFARSHHSAMRHVAPVRATLGIRTIFNLLGPLANPANAQFHVLGVFAPEWVRPMAEALSALGTTRAWVVHGLDGIDELSISGPSMICEVRGGAVSEFTLTPEDAGLSRHPLSSLEGGDAQANARAILELLDGHQGPFRDVVLLNAAAGLLVSGHASDLRAGVARAAEAIDSGRAREALQALVKASKGAA